MQKVKRISQKDFQRIDLSELEKLCPDARESRPRERKPNLLERIKIYVQVFRSGPVFQ